MSVPFLCSQYPDELNVVSAHCRHIPGSLIGLVDTGLVLSRAAFPFKNDPNDFIDFGQNALQGSISDVSPFTSSEVFRRANKVEFFVQA